MTPLVIGIDARELLGDRTGVGRYLGELLHRWTARADAISRRFILYAPEPLRLSLPAPAATTVVQPGGRGTWWEQTTLRSAVLRDRPDVFFAPAYTAPLRLPVPSVVTIHDVSFSRHPEWFRRREGMRRRWLTRQSARTAAVVLTDSRFSRQEIHQLYGLPLERIRVVPVGVAVREIPSGVAREPLVLYSGSIFNRRRLPDLIAAFALVARSRPDARLVIVGDDRSWPAQDLNAVAAAHGVTERVSLRRFIPEEELIGLYARASVFAFLSEYEGFGLTPLEALAAGVPPVVGDTPVAREVYGDAALFVPLHDVSATARAIDRLLGSADARAEIVERAPAVLARYSWDRAADETLGALEEAARR